MKLTIACALVAVGCASKEVSSDITGPFDGAPHRFVVDSIMLPIDNKSALAVADDLNGDGTPDNTVGEDEGGVINFGLANDTGNASTDMIASGAIASSLVIYSDDLDDNDKVGVSFFGVDGAAATPAGGRIADGVFISNLTRTTAVPGEATIVVPFFADADPLVLSLDAMELELVPDATGYVATLRGGIDRAIFLDAAYAAVTQSIAADPGAVYSLVISDLDANDDGTITKPEFDADHVVVELTEPDVTLFHRDELSFAFQVHVVPCETGRCDTAPPTVACLDRILDGDETSVDCGGSCMPCPGGATCQLAGDCQTDACVAGKCLLPSCDDGLQDGFETGVDCGDVCHTECD